MTCGFMGKDEFGVNVEMVDAFVKTDPLSETTVGEAPFWRALVSAAAFCFAWRTGIK